MSASITLALVLARAVAAAILPGPRRDEIPTGGEAPGAFVPTRLPADYLHFEGACDGGPVVTIAAVGDVLLHHELQKQAYRDTERYRVLWADVIDLLARSDVTYANLEGPTAFGITRKDELVPDPGLRFDNAVYTGYPRFNYHPALAEDLVSSGVDVVSTANNHALDRGSLGIDRTLDALDGAGLRHTGTRRRGSDDPWHAVTRAHGLAIAWLACTLHTNFGKDEHGQVLHCFDRDDAVRRHVAALASDPAIDAVIVTPHWGKEYAPEPEDRQREYAQRWIDAGAIAVIGAHPHVLEPWEKRVAADGREAFVLYSLGNFVSHQQSLDRRSTIVLYLGLRKHEGRVRVVGARYVPLHVRMQGNKDAFFVEVIDRQRGPADARAHVLAVLGKPNAMDRDAPLDVAPHCDPAWPHHRKPKR